MCGAASQPKRTHALAHTNMFNEFTIIAIELWPNCSILRGDFLRCGIWNDAQRAHNHQLDVSTMLAALNQHLKQMRDFLQFSPAFRSSEFNLSCRVTYHDRVFSVSV